MGIRATLKSAIVVGLMVTMGAGAALAQACTETEFTSKTGQTYLEAEQAAMVNKDFSTAIAKLNSLRNQPLNCYEEGAVIKLSAYIKIENGDRKGAVQDLLTALNKGYIPETDAAQTYYNIAQIYLQEEDLAKALEYMNKWQQAGGKPDRTQKWQLAVLNQRADKFKEAVRWAEEVRREDGSNFKQEVYDLLLFLYNQTGEKAKMAEVLEVLVERNPAERKYWDAIAGNYFADNEERKAFEVQKAMYLGGLLTTQDELMRIVNFYNRFNAPYHAARILEKEMNAGRITKNLDRLELLANLYQVAREHEKAIPVIRQAADAGGGGAMYERLGRSFADLQKWKETEEALTKAISMGGVKDRGNAYVLIGQSRYERGDRAGARESFKTASNNAGRSWLAFMNSEENTKRALVCFEVQSAWLNVENEAKICKRLAVLGDENLPENCKTIKDRLEAAEAKFNATPECKGQAT
ncbi:tetratricopeptide repeat protein [Hyphomonas sp.]|uniref:tetratricopeptide repeat protein n=1 Tax=Hyphomonas sp. TaxID=87 RepID=UPI003D2CB460